MRVLPYLLGASMLITAIDVIFTITTVSLYACPRCRRALPKGPRKLPHPGFNNKNEKPVNSPAMLATIAQEAAIQSSVSCAQSCCCARQKTSSFKSSQNKLEENLNE